MQRFVSYRDGYIEGYLCGKETPRYQQWHWESFHDATMRKGVSDDCLRGFRDGMIMGARDRKRPFRSWKPRPLWTWARGNY